MSDKRKIILNNVFPDATYNTGNNLYHETINLFKSDNEDSFIHLNAKGTYDKEEPVDVLNVARAGKGLYQILSVAENCKVFAGAKKTGKDKGEERYNAQRGKITYGGLFVEDYFADNKTFYGEKEKDLFVTFKCGGIYEPDSTIYIAFNKCVQSNSAVISEKISKEKFSATCRIVDLTDEDQEKIRKILPNEQGRRKVGTFEQRYNELKEKSGISYEENYFSVLGVDKKELQYSNAIAKILQFREEWMSEFIEKVLRVENCKQNAFEIKREEKNTDILFRDLTKETGKIIIIENKVEAGLTLSKYNNLEDQAKAVFRDVFSVDKGKEEQNENWKNYNNKISAGKDLLPSQLSKYYLYALCWALKAGWSKEQIENNIYCFFLCPNYHEKMYAVDNNEKQTIFYAFADKYKMITYSTIKEFFKAVKDKNEKDLTTHQKFIVEDFIDAVSALAKRRDDSVELSMIRMFIERHDKLQKLKNK